jgi:hypothetical protein
MDSDCKRPPADETAVRLHRTALEDGPSVRRTATPSSGWRAVGPSVRRSRRPTDSRRPRRPHGRWQTVSPSAWRTLVGSSNASGRPADADMDVRTRDNPGNLVTSSSLKERAPPFYCRFCSYFYDIFSTYTSKAMSLIHPCLAKN